MEKILKIEDIENYEEPYSNYEGFKITTDEQEILILITNQQGCCESWGHIASEDDFKDFIDAELNDVVILPEVGAVTESFREKMKEKEVLDVYDGGAVFVSLLTNKGTLQFAVYNSHNGYYGHNVKVISKQITEECCI